VTVIAYSCADVEPSDEEVIHVGGEMSDVVLRGFMKPVEVDKIKSPGRGSSDFFPRIAKLFLASGAEAMEIDYKAMGRKWSAVAQGLRIALKDPKNRNEDGVLLSDLAWVSVDTAAQTIYLRMRTEPAKPDEGRKSPGRSKKAK
jgi:hypothetical protein